jgi:hypothetical protein
MNDCAATGKVAYHSKLEALKARGKINARVRKGKSKRTVFETTPYRCPYCKLWHFTSGPK